MEKKITIKEAERKVIRMGFYDGLWDIAGGLIILAISLAIILKPVLPLYAVALITLLLATIAIGLAITLRKGVVKPRLGEVSLRSSKLKDITRFWLVMIIVGMMVFAFVILMLGTKIQLPNWLVQIRGALFFLMLALIPFGSLSLYFGVPRLLIYGILIGIVPLFDELIMGVFPENGFVYGLWAVSLIVVITGSVLFVRFLNRTSEISKVE